MQHIHTGAGIKKDQSLLGPDPFSVLLQQQAEHQGEQSHRFDNTNDDEVVGRALSGFTQSICGGLGHLALEKGGQKPMARPAKIPVNIASRESQPPSTALRMKFISKKP